MRTDRVRPGVASRGSHSASDCARTRNLGSRDDAWICGSQPTCVSWAVHVLCSGSGWGRVRRVVRGTAAEERDALGDNRHAQLLARLPFNSNELATKVTAERDWAAFGAEARQVLRVHAPRLDAQPLRFRRIAHRPPHGHEERCHEAPTSLCFDFSSLDLGRDPPHQMDSVHQLTSCVVLDEQKAMSQQLLGPEEVCTAEFFGSTPVSR